MYCPNCREKIIDNSEFCPKCGKNLKMIKESNNNFELMQINQENSQSKNLISNNIEKKKNKSKRDLMILAILIVIVLPIIFLFINKKRDLNKNDEIIDKNEEIIDKNDEEINKENFNTYIKLKNDYKNGNIDVNRYFQELFYNEYDSSKLDKKYKSNQNYGTTGNVKELLELLEQHENEIDKELVKKFLINVSLSNVKFENSNNKEKLQSRGSESAKIEFLDNEKDNAYNHKITHVKLSSNENFLLWYTKTGEDAITEKMLNDIDNGLEKAISDYEKLFNVKYKYSPYVDNKYFNEDYNNAKDLLEIYNIPLSKLKKSMSVYIFDTGSDSVSGTYIDFGNNAKVLNRFIDILDKDGIINYPYIVLNQRKLKDNHDSFKQVYNHELFHHFQYIYCMDNIDARCNCGYYVEGTANLASALLNESTTTKNFLNGHATTYAAYAYKRLSTMTDGASYGYATFPYLYVYSKNVKNWSDVIMKAHLEKKPYDYIQNNTSKEELNKVSDKITYGLLANNFENKALYSNHSIKINGNLNTTQEINDEIEPGAMLFYEASGKTTIEVVSGNKDYVGVKLYGYKDGIYSEILSSYDKINFDLTYYVKYDKFFIAINNSNLVDTYTYKINVQNSKFEENDEFKTSFDNYNIEIKMNISISGVNSSTISKGIMDEKHQKEYLDVTTNTMGIVSLSNKVYYDYNKGYSYITQPYGGDVWWKDKSAKQMVDLNKVIGNLKDTNKATKISSNHYKVKMSGNDVKDIIASGNSSSGGIKGDIFIDVYTENGYITRLDYDFTKMIKGFDKFTTQINISNYNKAGNVEIPESIIKNAKTH